MPKRMLQLLGGLLAVASLAVGPSAASGDTGGTAKAAGNGGCYDNHPPYSHWGQDWWDRDGGGRYWNGWGDGDGSYFDGRSYDNGCGRYGYGRSVPATAAGRVVRVMVAAKRLRGPQCQHLYRSGRLSRPGSCTHTHWMRADGTSSWRFAIPRELPGGHYRLIRRAVDAAGNHERKHRLHLSIR